MWHKRRLDIESFIFPAFDFGFIWSPWVPKKVNVFGWRASIDRIPSKLVLSRWYIIPDSYSQVWGSMEENTDRILMNCHLAKRMWSVVTSWCKLLALLITSVIALLNFLDSWPLNQREETSFELIFITPFWCLWKTKNERNFNKLSKTDSGLLGDIFSLLFLRIKTS